MRKTLLAGTRSCSFHTFLLRTYDTYINSGKMTLPLPPQGCLPASCAVHIPEQSKAESHTVTHWLLRHSPPPPAD